MDGVGTLEAGSRDRLIGGEGLFNPPKCPIIIISLDELARVSP